MAHCTALGWRAAKGRPHTAAHLHRFRQQLCRLHNRGDQPPLPSCGGVDAATSEAHQASTAWTDDPGQLLGQAPAGVNPELTVCVSKDGVRGCHQNVTAEGKFKASGERKSGKDVVLRARPHSDTHRATSTETHIPVYSSNGNTRELLQCLERGFHVVSTLKHCQACTSCAMSTIFPPPTAARSYVLPAALVRSTPAENARPAPVRITTRTPVRVKLRQVRPHDVRTSPQNVAMHPSVGTQASSYRRH